MTGGYFTTQESTTFPFLPTFDVRFQGGFDTPVRLLAVHGPTTFLDIGACVCVKVRVGLYCLLL